MIVRRRVVMVVVMAVSVAVGVCSLSDIHQVAHGSRKVELVAWGFAEFWEEQESLERGITVTYLNV